MFQTSSKTAVETTELTRSFGWDSSEAWQQHDIQELCRVMFDALEQKFKDTDQADLIQRLYEGKIFVVFGLFSAVFFIVPNIRSSLFLNIAC
jgi:ubiquitin carboxyl-terminal hydrolase 47